MIKKILAYFCLIASSAYPNADESEGVVKVRGGELYFKTFGKGEPLVVLHGGPGLSHDYFLPQLIKLAEKNLVIFYDQRGSGRSLNTKIDEEYINSDQFVEDLETLRQSLGLEKFILMGHSWGGMLAMQYATKYPDNLSGLILLNSSPANFKGQKAFIDEFAKRTKDILDDIKPLFAFEDFKKLNATQITEVYRQLFSVYCDDPEKSQKLNLNFNGASAQSGFKVMEEMSKTSWLHPSIDVIPKLKDIKVPTLILHGKQDIVPLWTAEDIKNAISDSDLVILDHCGHFPFIEQPTLFFETITLFLNKLNPHPSL